MQKSWPFRILLVAVTAVGKNVALQPSSMVTVYWGVDKR
jgi:hypothetical protein